MDTQSLIDKVYRAHMESGLYDDSFENVIYKLTNAYDYFFIGSFKDAKSSMIAHRPFHNDPLQITDHDIYRGSYRACLKFVHEDCKHGSFDLRITPKDIFDYQAEIRDTEQFNFIRNTIERYRLGEYKASVENGSLHFEHIPGNRGLEYDFYSRQFADSIPGGKNDKDTLNLAQLYEGLFLASQREHDFKSKKLFKPQDDELRKLIQALKEYFLGNIDERVLKLKPLGYTVSNYLECYCYLAAIAYYKTSYLMSLSPTNDHTYQPAVLYPKDRLIEDISEITTIPAETVSCIIRDMTYDYSLHKNSVTIYQPLFEVGDKILYSSALVLHAYVIDKMMKFADHEKRNEADSTIYHKILSDQMNHRMAEYLAATYENLLVFENKKLTIDDLTVAEIDLTIIDKNSKAGMLVELKNYAPVDDDKDAVNKEKKINSAIASRCEKDKRVIDNLKLFFEQNGIPTDYLGVNFSSLLVTNAFSGGIRIKDTIKVIDEPLFYYLIALCRGNIETLTQEIKEETLMKLLRENMSQAERKNSFEYKGIKTEVAY